MGQKRAFIPWSSGRCIVCGRKIRSHNGRRMYCQDGCKMKSYRHAKADRGYRRRRDAIKARAFSGKPMKGGV